MVRKLAPWPLLACLVLLIGANYAHEGESCDPTGTTRVGLPLDPIDTFTVVFTINDTITYNEADPPTTDEAAYVAYNAAVAAADQVIELGTDVDFAHGYVRQDVPRLYNAMDNQLWLLNGGPSDTWDTELSATTNDRRLALLYVDFASVIPPSATILDANLHMVPRYSAYIDHLDSLVATLMTVESDTAWYKNLGNTSNVYGSTCSWTYQNQTGICTGSDAWTPALNDRDTWLDWGDVSDMSAGSATNYAIEANAHWPFRIRNCVQAAVNGKTNNGIMLFVLEAYATLVDSKMYHWENLNYRPPWIEITYTTRSYSPPFDGKEWAFVFSTDDGVVAANDSFANVFSEFDARFTAFVSGGQQGRTEYWDAVDAARWAASPYVEVGNHSRKHPVGGLTCYGATGPITPGDAAWDSLLVDTDPAWLHTVMQEYDGDRREEDAYFNQSFALPEHAMSGAVQLALDYWGYNGWRTGGAGVVTLPDGPRVLLKPPSEAGADTAIGGFGIPHNPRQPRNLDLVPLTLNTLFGDSTSVLEPAVVKAAARRRIRSLQAQGFDLLSIYTHDVKLGATGSTGQYGGGIEPSELLALAQQVQDMDGAFLCVTDYVNAMKARATPTATPTSYGQPADYRWSADDLRFWIPCGAGRSGTESAIREENLPRTEWLAQNVPNPFNPCTTIAFDLPRQGHVKLMVYDVAGLRVTTLVDGLCGAGHHVVVWNGEDAIGHPAATGIYLYCLDCGRIHEVNKMTLIR